MKFVLTTSSYTYENSVQRKKYEDLGFRFKFYADKNFSTAQIDCGIKPEIEINTLEELLKFVNDFGDIIIKDYGKEIEIYDGYRE